MATRNRAKHELKPLYFEGLKEGLYEAAQFVKNHPHSVDNGYIDRSHTDYHILRAAERVCAEWAAELKKKKDASTS